MCCDTNQFPALPYCGPHQKSHGERGLSNNSHLRFDPKLGHGICEILRIPCAYVGCKLMMDKNWIYGILSKKQVRYQPVTNCTYFPVQGSDNNWNIIELTPKSTTFEVFDEVHKVVLDRISENMALLVQSGMYDAIDIDDNTKHGFYVIQLLSGA